MYRRDRPEMPGILESEYAQLGLAVPLDAGLAHPFLRLGDRSCSQVLICLSILTPPEFDQPHPQPFEEVCATGFARNCNWITSVLSRTRVEDCVGDFNSIASLRLCSVQRPIG